MTELSRIVDERWDAVVVGTGMAGATLGYALARAGWRVLFCERGKCTLVGHHALRGEYPEIYFPQSEASPPEHRQALREAGRYVEEVCDLSHGKPRRFIPFIGSGTGGSSALYGMALERFSPADFTPREHYPHAADSTLPESWPISYACLAPFYAAAERLYRVRAGVDHHIGEPARSANAVPGLSPAAQELAEFLQRQGLHPYRLPLACDFVPGCSGCQGYLCAKNCKRDSGRACLRPALDDHGAQLLDECEVSRLEANGNAVTSVVCRRGGSEFRVTGRIILLAAGALNSPSILLRSASAAWPHGLANESGLVGKNLMRHYVDLYAIFPKRGYPTSGNLKELGCNDFYLAAGKKFGTLQSFGPLPPASMLVQGMQDELRSTMGRWVGALFAPTKPVLAPLLRRIFRDARVFATVMEDLPYRDNHVALPEKDDDFGSITLRYRIREHDAGRIADLRKRVRAVFKSYRVMLLRQAENNERLAHACGTCRFGNDPRSSVVDANNKAHGLENLYVVDASFFPSSGGTNPALTIAANALRVAHHLTRSSG